MDTSKFVRDLQTPQPFVAGQLLGDNKHGFHNHPLKQKWRQSIFFIQWQNRAGEGQTAWEWR